MAECTTCQHKKVCKYVEQYVSAGIKVKETVHECVDYAPTAEWIDVNERLPENDYGKHWKDRQYYLVLLKPSGLMRVAKFGYKEHNWWIDSHDSVLDSKFYTEVTHWMPLPEPPKGESDNG